MKTISQAAKEYSEKVNGNYYNDLYPNCDETIGEITEKEFQAGAEFVQRWIPVEEELPPSQKSVLVKVLLKSGKECMTIAKYIPPKTVKADDFLDDEYSDGLQEYDEEIDDFWVKEAWFEWLLSPDVNYKIDENVTHWRPIEYK